MHEQRIGTSAMARMLDVTPAAVTHLKQRRRGASAVLIAKVETITHGKVTAKELTRDAPRGAQTRKEGPLAPVRAR